MGQRKSDGSLSDHYVICNWNDLGDEIVRQLHAPVVGDLRPIVIVTERPEAVPQAESACADDPYRNVFVIPGDPTSDRILARANIAAAGTAIVLSDPGEGDYADTKSVLIALAVEAIEAKVHTIVELLHSKNRIHFQHTSVDEVVCVDELSEKLLSQSALTHGLSEFYTRLLTATEDTNEVYVVSVPGAWVGQTYRRLAEALIDYDAEDVILVGLQTAQPGNVEPVLAINPPAAAAGTAAAAVCTRDHVLQVHDRLFLIAYRPPALSELHPPVDTAR